MHKLTFLIILIIGFSIIPYSFSEDIPAWVKNNAEWWSERTISQSEFTNALEFLINEGIIFVPPTEPLPPGPDKIIPDWVRNTVGWWADDKIPDSEFINAMKYLIEIGIIEVNASSANIITENSIAVSDDKIIDLNVVLDGITNVHSNKKFLLDIKIQDMETYSGNTFSIHRNGIDGVDVNIQLFNQEGELIHVFDTVTQYNGLAQYDVMAKETLQDRGLWLVGNTYNVKISAILGESSSEKYFEFIGKQHESSYNQGPSLKAPRDLTATAGDDKVTLSWSAPSGGARVTDYKIEYCKIEPPTHNGCPSYDSDGNDSGNHWTAFSHDPTDIVGCNNVTRETESGSGITMTYVVCDTDVSDVVTGLENETQYLFRVAPISNSGVGKYTPTVTATTT